MIWIRLGFLGYICISLSLARYEDAFVAYRRNRRHARHRFCFDLTIIVLLICA